jgi:hypothetical protein
MLWLLTLPIRIFFGILMLPFLFLVIPFLLLRVLFKTALALVVLPVVFVVAIIGVLIAALAVSFAILIPLAPFALVALLVWMLVTRSSPVASGARG